MDMRDIKLIAADMDKTLLTDNNELPPGFEERVLKLKEKGIQFAIASGRSIYTLKDIFGDFSENLVLIAENGGVLWKDGRMLFKETMDAADCREMIMYTLGFPGKVPVLCGYESSYIPTCYIMHDSFIKTFFTRVSYVDDPASLSVEAAKFSVYFPEENSRFYFENYYEPRYKGRFSTTLGGVRWLDIMKKGISKGGAVKFLIDSMGLSPDNFMAFGDTYNDKEMLQTVGWSYIMANADPDMGRYARFVAPSNNEYGVMKVVDQVLAALS